MSEDADHTDTQARGFPCVCVLSWVSRFMAGWLILALIGWLAYALLRALTTIIFLDVPFFDWQWYIPVMALLIVAPIYLVSRWLPPRSTALRKRTLLAFAILVAWAITGYNGFNQSIGLNLDQTAPIRISYWAFLDLRSASESLLRDIAAARGRVYLDIGRRPYNAVSLAAAMRRLAAYNVEAYWMPNAGNFLSTPVYREWIENAREAAALIRREGLSNVRGLIGDVEPPMNMPLDLTGADQAQFDQAVNDLQQLMNEIHREYPGRQLGVTALWAHYLDSLDGDADLSILMRSPMNPPGNWDFVNLMTYSSFVPPDWRAYYVYLSERAMMRLYPPDRVSHLIGLIGGGMPGEPLIDFDELVRDARLSSTAVISCGDSLPQSMI